MIIVFILHPLISNISHRRSVMLHHTHCPVSGLLIEVVKDVSLHIHYEGMELYFCCLSCEDTFLKDPDRYLAGKDSYRSFNS